MPRSIYNYCSTCRDSRVNLRIALIIYFEDDGRYKAISDDSSVNLIIHWCSMPDFPNFSVVIAAGGAGKRFGSDKPKQFLEIQGEPVIIRALAPFCAHPHSRKIVVAVHLDWFDWLEQELSGRKFGDCIKLVPGGEERSDSVYAGLQALDHPGIVLIHDAARPFVSLKMISDSALAASEFGAAAVAVPVTDTLKKEKDGYIAETVDRTGLWRVQTPQAFRYEDIMKAYKLARKDGYKGTDDCVLVEKYLGMKVKIVRGAGYNIKITTPEDLKIAETLATRH